MHDYGFELIAVNVAALPGLAADPESTAVVTALAQHTAARAKLAVRSSAARPRDVGASLGRCVRSVCCTLKA